MSIISKRCQYALQALSELARSQVSSPLNLTLISEKQKIPLRFLESIMRELRTRGIVDSHRGKIGGYTLSRPAANIGVGEIVAIFQTPNAAKSRFAESSSDTLRMLRDLELTAEKALLDTFNTRTLQDLLRSETTLEYSI